MNRFAIALVLLAVAFSAAAETTAIVGAKVHTVGPQGTIENATIIIVDDKIHTVGIGIGVPDGATRIDATGKIITPGLFSSVGRLGLIDVAYSAGPVDSAQLGDQFTASFDVADAYNPRSTTIAINRIEGVTRAAITPAPGFADEYGNVAHVISGLAAIVNLGDENGLHKRGAAMVVSLGENGSDMGAGSRTGAWLVLRNALDEAIDYRDHKGDFERGMRRKYQHSVADLEALQDVISGDIPLLADTNRASDIEALIELTDSYSLRAIINGGAEAWMLADEIAAAGLSVIMSPTHNLPSSFDAINARLGAANILVAAGVSVALAPDVSNPTQNARNITQSAGNAVADGLDWDAALRAITLAPAEIYGVADSLGSIEPGKAADLVIWPADPLELTTYAEAVFINGEVIPMVSRQTLLRDRYLQSDSSRSPAYRD
jgi:imidazolonepropionase-like amidohydrolase